MSLRFTEDLRKKMQLEQRVGVLGWLTSLFSPGFVAVCVYRIGRAVAAIRFLPLRLALMALHFLLFYIVQALYGISIQAYAVIGRRFAIVGMGCIFVVAESIGDDFTVSPGVTVGNVRGSARLPIIGDRVYIEPGAKVLGPVRIGDNVVIRANSLVLRDVPSNSLVVGNPARVKPLPEGELDLTA